MRDDDCLDLGINYRYGEKQRDLRCFGDGAGIGLMCGKGGLDFCLEQPMVLCVFGKVKIGREIG